MTPAGNANVRESFVVYKNISAKLQSDLLDDSISIFSSFNQVQIFLIDILDDVVYSLITNRFLTSVRD